MLEGLWTLSFASNVGGAGNGIVVFETQKIFGGDADYYYLGSYDVKNEKIKAEVKVTFYGNSPNSIFGEDQEFELIIEGKLPNNINIGNNIELRGYRKDSPEKIIVILCKKRENLP